MNVMGNIVVQVCDRLHCQRLSATVTNTRTSGFLNHLAQNPNTDLRTMVASLFALCPVAHLATLDAVTRASEHIEESARRGHDQALTERAIALEGMMETLRVLLTDGTALLKIRPQIESFRVLGSARTELMRITPILLELGRHPLEAWSSDPELAQKIKEAHLIIERALSPIRHVMVEDIFGATPGEFSHTVTSLFDAREWFKSHQGIVSQLGEHLLKSPLFSASVSSPMLPYPAYECAMDKLGDELYWRLKNEPGFDMSPVWQGAPHLTGAIVRQSKHPLIDELIHQHGFNEFTLVMARLIDLDRTFTQVDSRLSSFELTPILTIETEPDKGGAIALTQTARGLLTYAKGTKGACHPQPFYGVISPTEWQFSPGGPGQQAVTSALWALSLREGKPTDEQLRQTVKEALFGLDACVPVSITRLNDMEEN